ncbi:MAG: hypothetical protein ACYC0F_15020 [Rhodanobacter sp.]
MTSFDKYAKTLSYFLPSRLRKEVVREVMSDLYAELEAERQLSPNDTTESLMKRVLAKHESPRVLARSFAERRSELIGWRVYPVYKWALWMSLAITLLTVVPLSLLSGFHWQMLTDLTLSLVLVFTIVTLVFLAIDQLGPLQRVADAMSLNQPIDSVEPADLGVDIGNRFVSYRRNRRLLAIALLLCLNLVPSHIGLPILSIEPSLQVAMYPVLSATFLGTPRMMITIWGVLVLLWDLLLTGRRFARFEAASEVALQFIGLALGLALLTYGHIFAVPDAAMTASYSDEMRIMMNTVVAPYLFKILVFVLWLSWIAKAWGFCMRLKRQILTRAL